MRRVRRLAAAALLGAGVLAMTAPAHAALVQLTADLSGLNEVPVGDPDGTGLALLTIDDGAATVDWTFTVNNIESTIIGAHIHQAPAGVNGPIVVDFSSQLSGSGLSDPDLLAVVANPSGFYVNIHTPSFPAGAIRGQLRSVPEPGMLGIVGLALGVLVMARRHAR